MTDTKISTIDDAVKNNESLTTCTIEISQKNGIYYAHRPITPFFLFSDYNLDRLKSLAEKAINHYCSDLNSHKVSIVYVEVDNPPTIIE